MGLDWASLQGGASALAGAARGAASEAAALALGQPDAVAATLALAGLVLLAVGIRWPRVAGALGGAAVGGLAVLAARGWLLDRWPDVPLPAFGLAAAAGLLAAGALWPRGSALAAGALLGGVLCSALALGGGPRAVPAVGALLLGLVAWLAWRKALAALAALAGAALLGGALLAWLPQPLAGELAGRPAALLTWLATLTAVGLAFQLGAAPGSTGRLSPADRPAAPAARSPGSPS